MKTKGSSYRTELEVLWIYKLTYLVVRRMENKVASIGDGELVTLQLFIPEECKCAFTHP